MQHESTDRTTWLVRRRQLLEREKAFTRAKDELAEARRALPWVRIDKPYSFDTNDGAQTLAQLFGSRSQLLVYHFMFGPNAEAGCRSCSFWADHLDACLAHLQQRDVSLVVVSRGPLAKLQAFKQKNGWDFAWVSSGNTDFNFDFGVSVAPEVRAAGKASYNYTTLSVGTQTELPGLSAFYKDREGHVFHTYSTYGRGIELANATYQLLDLLPRGRDEGELPQPMAWVKFKHEYPAGV
jgi:predicted dithiol-disulfide oxidoreductase (DUF899 family)